MSADIEKTQQPLAPSGSGDGSNSSLNRDNAEHPGDFKHPAGIPAHRSEYASELAAMSREEYLAFEKKLVWKMDKKIIPWITVLYLMSFLDRVNVGAAKLVGLTTQLNLDSLQYSNVSMIFFVSYVAFEIPSNLVLRKFRPSRWIPFTMVCWAIVQACMGLVTNYGQLLALRFVLGIFEAGLFPGLNLYLTGWYRREELNKRCSIFFVGAVLAGAFGSLFGYGISYMNGVGGRQGWAWIFILEGILTGIIAIVSFWMVHDWPEQAKFLTPLERECVLERLQREQGLAGEGTLTKNVIKSALKDWKVYCLMLMYIGAAEPLYSGSLFSPTIIAALGTFSVTTSLALATPPYVLCFITTMATAFLSDRYKRRGLFLMFWFAMAAIGYILLLAIPITAPGALYFAVFVTVASTGPLIGTTIAWTGNTWGNHYKKAICMGLVFSSGNSGGIVSSQAYRNQDAPTFRPGHGTALAFCCMGFIMAGILWWGNARENRRRDEKYGPAPGRDEMVRWDDPAYLKQWGLEGKTRDEIVELGDDHPAYRYVY